MSSNVDQEIPLIREKFMKADYPLRFLSSVVNEFQKSKECGDESMVITWKTRNIRSLFPLKDKNDYKCCFIHKGDCSCGPRYIDETKRNAEC